MNVKTIGVVSGAGKPDARELEEFLNLSVDLYISGETSESVPHKLAEAGINYFVCGHYATETFGIKALAGKLKDHFKDRLAIEFIDLPSVI